MIKYFRKYFRKLILLTQRSIILPYMLRLTIDRYKHFNGSNVNLHKLISCHFLLKNALGKELYA